MKDFSFSVLQNVEFGKGSINKLPGIVKKLNSEKALIISGQNLTALGVVDKIKNLLEASGIACEAFIDVEANPSVETVNAAAKAYLKCGATSIIALGGGSPMDVAKAAGILVKYGGDITKYEGAHRVPGKIAPVIAIPTTAGTGSEVTAFTVITDKTRNYKLTVFSYELVPCYALLDPDMIATLPPSIAAATGMDALVHAIESYLSTAASPFSDAMAEKAMELIGKSIRPFVANRKNEEAAANMLCGSMFAGIAFAWARLGNVHAMAHPLGGFFDVPHGVANAILLPVVLEYNSIADNGRYERIYNYIRKDTLRNDGFTSSMLVDEVKKLTASLAIPINLAEVGVKENKISAMAADAMKSGNILVNPRQSTQKEIEMLYWLAM